MTTSQILFLTGLLCGVFFAGVAVYAQARQGAPFGRRYSTVPTWILLGGAALGAAAFLLDSGVAGRTLYETEVARTEAATPRAARSRTAPGTAGARTSRR